jgi:oligopeptide transport system substrate-binding protein
MRTYGRLAALLLLLACALIMAGCGRKGAGGSVLRYALQNAPTTLDPARVEDGDTIDLLMQIFEGLVQWNEKNEIVPNIAEKWEVSPDGRVYTFHLRDNVYFHAPFKRKVTAADFVYSITRALRPETKSGTAKTYLFDIVGAADMFNKKANTVSGLKAPDDRTLQITLDKNRLYFLGKLTYPTAYVVCKEAIEKNGNQFDEKTMIGTGPFKLASYQAGYEVKLAANPDYHGGRPVLDGIVRPVLPDSTTRQTTYESGGTDITDVQPAELDRIKADPALSRELKRFPRPVIWYLALNQQAFEPFKKKEVRQAFAMAINKDALIRLAQKDAAHKANGILPPGVPGYDPDFPGLPYNPEKARQLLAAAGYPGGRNFPKLTISFRQGYKYIEDGVLAIRNDLKQNLGVETDVRQVEWSRFLTERGNGTMPCYHLRWMADYLDPQDFLSVMLRTGAQENTLGYSNPEFDRLCDRADTEPDPQKRLALYRQAERIAVDDAPWVVLYFQDVLELHKPYVRGIRDSLMGHLPHVTTTVAH